MKMSKVNIVIVIEGNDIMELMFAVDKNTREDGFMHKMNEVGYIWTETDLFLSKSSLHIVMSETEYKTCNFFCSTCTRKAIYEINCMRHSSISCTEKGYSARQTVVGVVIVGVG